MEYFFKQELSEDIRIGESSLWKQFQSSLSNGDYTTASNILRLNSSLGSKVINADKINQQSQGLEYLETNIKNNIDVFLNNLLTNLQTDINNLVSKGNFESSQTYYINNIVTYNNQSFLSLKQQTGNVPTNDYVSWVYLDLVGDVGYSNNLIYRGRYSSETSYSKNNVVSIKINDSNIYNALYVSMTDSNTDNPTSSNNWQIIMKMDISPQKISVLDSQPISPQIGEIWLLKK